MASTEEYQGKKKGGKMSGMKEFLYNSETGAIFGRTPASWGKITVFYLIYYSLLAGFFAICLSVFFTTLDKDHPRLQEYQSLMKSNPGMGFRPMPDVDSTLIKFTQGDESSYKIYTDHIQAFLDQYENKEQDSDDFTECKDGEDKDANKICRFQVDLLGEECIKEKDFGYDLGSPCVLLKLNKIYGWEPELYDVNGTEIEGFPDEGEVYPHSISITCEGENPADSENMGPVSFYPPMGLPVKYYPYVNQRGYRQPLVFARFDRPRNGVVMQIWCKAWAKNIMHHKNDEAGSIRFELQID